MVAEEYYNPSKHPTCWNFRIASKMLIDKWLNDAWEDTLCEIGAGRSVVAEILLSRGASLESLLITDESERMLAYSREFEAHGARLRMASAEHLPLAGCAANLVVASLGDPYNTELFWAEAYRILKPRAQMIFTCPSFEWAAAYRGDAETGFMKAEFALRTGDHVMLPSFIYSGAVQRKMIERIGFTVTAERNVTIGDLSGEVLSPKLCLERGPDGPVVTGYVVEKTTLEKAHQMLSK